MSRTPSPRDITAGRDADDEHSDEQVSGVYERSLKTRLRL